MTGFALGFGMPAVLIGLLALPVIWWLLRLTPPKPRREVFPPLRILAQVLQKEETPHKSPWWLTLLRLVLAGLVIVALARPILNPETPVAGSGPVAILMDNGWASAPGWERRVATAERLIGNAQTSGQTVVLAFTTDPANADIGPFRADVALDRLGAAEPHPVPVQRLKTYRRVAAVLRDVPAETLAILGDGVAANDDDEAYAVLAGTGATHILWAGNSLDGLVALTEVENRPRAFVITAARPVASPVTTSLLVTAHDQRGRQIAETALSFASGETAAQAEIEVPFELRNEFSEIRLDNPAHAAGIRLIDDNARRRRVALISAAQGDDAQPLLSPLFYIERALQPYADLVKPQDADLATAVPAMIDEKPAIIILADVGTLPDSASDALRDWVRNGGTLVRFAGPRMAATDADDEDLSLLPVRLRAGERALGGALSWTEPQPVAEFPPTGPFSDLTPPRDVTVIRQVLAEPEPGIAARTWANLADGTPLVTGSALDKGTIVLFHVTPEATWSNLPISGSFVDMLRRIIQLSRNQGTSDVTLLSDGVGLPPFRIITAAGKAGPPPPSAKPLSGEALVTIDNPPGLYGSEDGVIAHNLLAGDAVLAPAEPPGIGVPVTTIRYAFDATVELAGWLLAAALVLLAIDTLITFWMAGIFARRPSSARRPAVTAALVAIALSLWAFAPQNALASDDKPGDLEVIEAITKTRLAYVVTGNNDLDRVTRAGLAGLTRFLTERTALEPGEPAAIDPESDELAFFPIIYWALDGTSPAPSEKVIARIDAYMQQGGTLLFDTRDQFSSGFSGLNGTSDANRQLRDILDSLNIPPLEPVPPDHVLTKSFYILNDFPGRYAGGQLWVEASLTAQNANSRPVRTGDGVSPILITGNDLAGAWAIDAEGNPLLPTVPNNPLQRIYAYRAGVNIMMYMLTGNYKSDQVHIPALLERLGN